MVNGQAGPTQLNGRVVIVIQWKANEVGVFRNFCRTCMGPTVVLIIVAVKS